MIGTSRCATGTTSTSGCDGAGASPDPQAQSRKSEGSSALRAFAMRAQYNPQHPLQLALGAATYLSAGTGALGTSAPRDTIRARMHAWATTAGLLLGLVM